MNRAAFAIATAILTCGSTATAEEERQLDAHEHGHGTLNIAVDNRQVAMELIAPGADIVGFEHEAKTDEQKAAVAQARKTLTDVAALFQFPAEARCKLSNANVNLEEEVDDHDDHASHAHDDHDDNEHGEKHHDAGEAKAHDSADHSEFHATYKFDCASTTALSPIQTNYFKSFPNAKELAVTVVTDTGQTRVEISADKPRIEF